jgi:recombination associated protein RdgC
MAEDNIIFQISDEKRRRQLYVKKIKLSDTLVDENTSISNDPAARLDADLALMAGEYCKIIPVLIDAFGGEADE